jgi:hypothetical protein
VTEELLKNISNKLNVIISLNLKRIIGDGDFFRKEKRTQGAGEIIRYLDSMGLNKKDIAEITGSPLASVKTLLTPKRRTSQR